MSVKTIDVHEFKNRRENDPRLCLIDVRELDEWQECRIPEAIHIRKGDILECIKTIIPDQNQTIYLYCHRGGRSMFAANALLTLGYTDIYSIDGGISEWAAAGYPIEK